MNEKALVDAWLTWFRRAVGAIILILAAVFLWGCTFGYNKAQYEPGSYTISWGFIPPFGQFAGKPPSADIRWEKEGAEGRILSGGGEFTADNTAQVEAMRIAIEGAIRAYMASQGVPLP